MKKRYKRFPFWVLTIAIFLISAFAFISFQLSSKVRDIEGKVYKNQEIILQLQNVQNALLYNETNAKSYVISPTPQLEDLLNEVPDLIRTEMKKLALLITDEPDDHRGIDSLLFFAEKRIEYSLNILKTRKESGFADAVAFINSTSKYNYVSKTRSLINHWLELEASEQHSDLSSRKNVLNNFNLLLLLIFFVMIILGIVYVVQLFKNIHQRTREIENAKYIETVLNTISEPVITTDANFKIRSWNESAEKVYGLDPVKSRNTDVALAVNSKIPDYDRRVIREEMSKNGFWKGEVKHLNAEGQEIVVQSLTSALVDKNGNLTGFVSANRDITEERMAKDLLSKFTQELASQVKEKTNELTNLFERVSDAFVALDINWRFTYLNKKAEQTFHKPEGYLIGKHIWTEFSESGGLPFYQACEQALMTQQYIYLEEYYSPYDSWFECRIYPSPTGISIYFRDITKKKKANETITKNEVRYRSLIEQASDGILVIDLQGTIIDVNPALCNMFGYSKEEVLQNNIISFLEPENLKAHPFGFQLLHDDRSHITERVGVHKNGTLIHIELNSKLIGEGKALSILRDVTERNKVQQEILNARDLSNSIIKSLPGIFYIVNENGRIIRWNNDDVANYGYSDTEISQMNCLDFFEEKDKEFIQQLIIKAFIHGKSSAEANLITKAGDKILFYLTASVIEFEGEKCLIGTGIDISDLRKTEFALKKLEERDRSLFESLDAAVVVHAADTSIIFNNHKASVLLGLSDDQLKGKKAIDPTWNFITENNSILQADQYPVNQILATKQPIKNFIVGINRTVTGDVAWVIINGFPVFNSNSEITEAVISFIDITELKKAEFEKVKERKENDALINTTSDLLWSVSNEYTLIAANSTFLKGLKENGGYVIKPGDNVLSPEYFPEEYLQYWKDIYKKGLAGETVLTEVFTPQANTSDLIWFEIKIDPILIEDKVTGIACSMRNITERKKAAEQLEEKTSQLQVLSDNLPDTMMYQVVAEPDGKMRFTYLSKSVQLLTGKTAEEVMQDPTILYNLIVEEDRFMVAEAENASMKEMQPFDVVVRTRNFSRALRWLHIRSIPRKLADGRIIWDGIHTDITKLKEAEIAVLKSKKHYQTLTEISPVGIFHTDINGSTTYVNPKWCRITGLSYEQALGNGWLNAVHEEDKQTVIDNWNKAFKNQEFSSSEYRFVRPDGSIAWVMGEAIPERNQENQIVGYVGTTTDITERKKMEEEKRWLSNTLQKSLDEIYMFNTENFQFEYANDGALSNLGYTTEEILKLTLLDIKPEMTLEKVKELVTPLLNKVKDKLVFETTNKRKDNSLYPVEVHLQMIEQGDRKIYLTITRDITERKNQQQKIEKEFQENDALINSTSDLLWSVDTNYKLISANDSLIHNVKDNGGPLLKKGDNILFKDFFPDEYIQYWKNIYDTGLSGKKQLTDIYIPETLRSELNWFELKADPIYVSDKITGIACSMRNITERKIITEALKESEEKYRALVENAPEALVVVDVELQKFISVSETAESLFKIPKDKLLELGPAGVSPEYQPDGRLSSEAAMEKIMEAVDGSKPDFEWMHCDNEGRLIPCEVRLVRLPSENKILVRGSITDITERKKAEENIRKSNERFELIGKATNDAIWEWNLETNEIWGNEAHQELYGLTIKDPVPDDDEWKKRLHPEEREKVIKIVTEAVASDRKSFDAEYRLFSENKGSINVFGSTYIERNNEGKAIRLLGNMTDITERKQKEQHLKLLESVITNTNDAVLITEAEPFEAPGPKIIYVNEAFCKMTGYNRDEVIGKTPRILQGPKTDRNELNRLKEAMKKWEPCEITTINYKKNGEEFWINFSISPVANEKGWFTHWISIDKDVTERKKEEKLLKESEEKYRSLIEQATDFIMITDNEGRFIDANSNFYKTFGYTKEEILQKTNYDVMDPEELKSDPVRFNLLMKNETILKERRMIDKHGEIIVVEANIKMLPDGRILAIARDIRDRKRAEQAIKESEEKYRTLVEQATDAIALYDASGKVLDVNTGSAILLGYTKEELIGKSLKEILSEEDLSKNPIQFDVLQKGQSTMKERKMRKKDGTFVQTEVRSQQLPDGRFLSVIRDLSERIKAEEDLKESYLAIRKLTSHIQNIREEERTSIAREIHDELGQQLTVIKMDVSWLKKEVGVKSEPVNNRLKELIAMLDETVKSVRRISSELRPSLLDDLGLAAAMEWQLQEFEKRSGISTRFINSGGEIKLPVAIKTSLYRIFQESLTNVARHSKAKNVTVSLVEKSNKLLLTIADNGKGFDKLEIKNKRTLGILGMKERTSMIDGIYEIVSTPDRGTVTTISVSLNNDKQ